MSLQKNTSTNWEPPPSGPVGGAMDSLNSRAYTFHLGSTRASLRSETGGIWKIGSSPQAPGIPVVRLSATWCHTRSKDEA
jgi:hypothetical protein